MGMGFQNRNRERWSAGFDPRSMTMIHQEGRMRRHSVKKFVTIANGDGMSEPKP